MRYAVIPIMRKLISLTKSRCEANIKYTALPATYTNHKMYGIINTGIKGIALSTGELSAIKSVVIVCSST